MAAGIAAALVAVAACQERAPTALDDRQLPEEPLTVEVALPWTDFGSNLQVLGGYASAAALGRPVVAHTYAGTLEARTLLRFGAFPSVARVFNANGEAVTDSDITYVAGQLVVAFDTISSLSTGPVTLRLGTLQEVWDARTASWTFALDTVADQRAWAEAGAGPIDSVATAIWDPSFADSAIFLMDSTAIARWVDATDQGRGGRVQAMTDGVRLEMNRARLRVSMRASVRPDTLAEDTVRLVERTFVYDPPPSAPVGMRVGGAPAWRTVMEVALPQLTGPPELCASVGCPFTPEAGHVSYAGLALTSRATEAAFQPVDTVRLDVRAVLSPPTLPKSPLGVSQTADIGSAVVPEAFGAQEGSSIDVPITTFMRTLLAGPDADGRAPPSTLALLTASEPSALGFASFFGPAELGEPVLRLILTVGTPQVLP